MAKKPTFLIPLGIIIIHNLLPFLGFGLIDVNNYTQLIPDVDLDLNAAQAFWYLHGQPPGFSFCYWLYRNVAGANHYFYINLLAIQHALAYYLFTAALRRFGFAPALQTVSKLLLLSPLVFIYFKYPMYAGTTFLACTLLLYGLSNKANKNAAFLYTLAGFSLACLFRNSWHLILIVLALIPLAWYLKPSPKVYAWALLILLPNFLWYAKNQYLYGKFTSSTWIGLNLSIANHYHCEDELSQIPPLEIYRPEYKTIVPAQHPLLLKYGQVPFLNRGNMHDVRAIILSDERLERLIQCYQPSRMIKPIFLDGIPTYFESPADYPWLYAGGRDGRVLHGIIPGLPLNLYDPFDLPNIQLKSKTGTYTFHLSFYTLVYPLVLLLVIFNFKKLGFTQRYLLAILLFFTAAYCTLDYAEANRMRFEVEPLWYFFTLLMIQFSLFKNNTFYTQ